MSTTTQTSAGLANTISEASLFGQEELARFTRGYERFLLGVMNLGIQQIEVAQNLVEGGMADLDLLVRADTPMALMQAEMEIFRRGSARATEAVRKISSEMGRNWNETCALVRSAAKS